MLKGCFMLMGMLVGLYFGAIAVGVIMFFVGSLAH